MSGNLEPIGLRNQWPVRWAKGMIAQSWPQSVQ
jgi:hypothetical protein